MSLASIGEMIVITRDDDVRLVIGWYLYAGGRWTGGRVMVQVNPQEVREFVQAENLIWVARERDGPRTRRDVILARNYSQAVLFKLRFGVAPRVISQG